MEIGGFRKRSLIRFPLVSKLKAYSGIPKWYNAHQKFITANTTVKTRFLLTSVLAHRRTVVLDVEL